MKKIEYTIYKLSDEMKSCIKIDAALFKQLDVKRGLRNDDGTGVLVGLTNIGNVVGYERSPEGLKPIEGELYYRGYEIQQLARAIMKEKRFGFEEIAYLLLSGKLPDKEELQDFVTVLIDNMPLEQKTILHIIELEGTNIMNILARSVLELYTFDTTPAVFFTHWECGEGGVHPPLTYLANKDRIARRSENGNVHPLPVLIFLDDNTRTVFYERQKKTASRRALSSHVL